MEYLEYTFTFPDDPSICEVLVAFLDANQYEGFQESGKQLIAYLPASKRDDALLESILDRIEPAKSEIKYTSRILPEINWNEKWERDFQPVEIDNFVRLRASFHPHDDAFRHEILIDPKMSFGTGHHATTQLMIRAMKTLSFEGKKVADLGCGTAVLSILASKMNADEIVAIDIDEWAVRNARENVASNQCSNITIIQGGIEAAGGTSFDVVLANINRNILVEHMCNINAMLDEGGTLVLSGIMLTDSEIVSKSALECNLRPAGLLSEKDWCALLFHAAREV